MASILVNTQNAYEVVIDSNILSAFGKKVATLKKTCKVLVVSDDIVHSLYGDVIYTSLKGEGYNVFEYTFSHGEKSKNLHTYADILSFLAKNSFTRSDLVVALGGGVVGDLSGFVAASYMRGIDYIQVPTTLLAMIDSSVGGKTAVDLEEGKNLVGAFYQPILVYADTLALLSLPCSEYKNGMGEGVKYAVLDGGELLDIVMDGVKCSNNSSITRFVELCVDSKRRIVVEDEKESNLRRLLNLGHTFAHAIEKLSAYNTPHGVCVSYGLDIVSKIAKIHNKMSAKTYDTIQAMLEKYEFNWDERYSMKDMINEIKLDKKVENNYLNIVMPYEIGDCRIEKIDLSKLEEELNC